MESAVSASRVLVGHNPTRANFSGIVFPGPATPEVWKTRRRQPPARYTATVSYLRGRHPTHAPRPGTGSNLGAAPQCVRATYAPTLSRPKTMSQWRAPAFRPDPRASPVKVTGRLERCAAAQLAGSGLSSTFGSAPRSCSRRSYLVTRCRPRVRLGGLHAWHRTIAREAGAAHPESVRVVSTRTYDRGTSCSPRLRERVYSDPAAVDDLTLAAQPAQHGSAAGARHAYNRSFELAPAGRAARAVLLIARLVRFPLQHAAASAELFPKVAATTSRAAIAGSWHAALRAARRALAGLVRRDRRRTAKHAAPAADPASVSTSPAISTGAALATLYSCARSTIRRYRKPRGPSMCYPRQSAFRGFARAHERRFGGCRSSRGSRSSRWIDVLPEYDPYKLQLVSGQRRQPNLQAHARAPRHPRRGAAARPFSPACRASSCSSR